jgi:hypothetical protein
MKNTWKFPAFFENGGDLAPSRLPPFASQPAVSLHQYGRLLYVHTTGSKCVLCPDLDTAQLYSVPYLSEA